MLRTFLFVVTCSAASAADLYTNCARTERTGALPLTADVKVTSSIAGEDGTCFKIAGTLEGKSVEGAIFDSSHPAVTAYYLAVRKPTPAPPAPAQAPEAAPPAPVRASRFANFSGTNLHDGERFELARVRSKLLLIHFWDSASDETARKDAEVLSHLRSQYGDQGLEVVGITNESNQDRIRAFNENAEAVWPLMRDRTGLAERYGVNLTSEIFVLDSHHKIVSSGARPADLEEMVSQRLGRR
jgi:peroxiredoxin